VGFSGIMVGIILGAIIVCFALGIFEFREGTFIINSIEGGTLHPIHTFRIFGRYIEPIGTGIPDIVNGTNVTVQGNGRTIVELLAL